MASTAVQNPAPVSGGESKSARKKKAKEGSVNGSAPSAVVPEAPGRENSSQDAKGEGDAANEHPYIKELAKHIRNAHKKLAGMQKVDAIIAENAGKSLDELVAERRINADQKAAAQKKPQIQQQLVTFEEQISQYRKFDADNQAQLQKQKDDLTSQHQKELEKLKEEQKLDGVNTSAAELRQKLLLFSQFLRAAAAKRGVEEEADTDESRAFEGALLLVYGGDEKAVETAVNLIEGSEEQVPNTDGVPLPVKYAQVKQASIDHAPFSVEETWVDSVAEANKGAEPASDPTIAHAGLTELDTTKPNGISAEAAQDSVTSPPQGNAGDEAGNAAGDRWDTAAAGVEKPLMEDSFEMVPRPQDELETPAGAAPVATQQEKTMNWADEPPAYESAASGNVAGESWDVKAPGEQTDDAWTGPDTTAPAAASGWADGATDTTPGAGQDEGDGFHQVPGRNRGRGRGRGGFRGEGNLRGRGRGGFRGRGEGGEFRGGEFRGRGGRGRGPRGGGAEGQTRGS